MKRILVTVISLAILITSKAYGQSPKEKAESIAAEFNKTKHKVKEKNGITTESHKVVEASPDIAGNIASYAGKYELDGLGHYILLHQSNNSWEAEFFKTENGKDTKLASLKDIKIESALLTATIDHTDGRSASFEGVFINRVENGIKSSGIGIRHLLELADGFRTDKVFYRKVE